MTDTAKKMEEINAQKEMKQMEMDDNEKQRQHERRENVKRNIANVAGGILGGIPRMFRFSFGGGKDDGKGYKSNSSKGRKNDPSYYKRQDTDISKSLNLPTYHKLGHEHYSQALLVKLDDGSSFKVAGITIIPHIPMLGSQISNDASENPINCAGARLKTQTLKSNSRSTVSYEGSDEVLNVLCTADIITALIESGRVLKLYETYIYDNAYFAESLITALGIDYQDLDNNIADYRKKWTALATDFNATIVAPAQMTLFMRKIYLASNVFADGDQSHVKQIYAYRQVFFNKLNDVGNGTEVADFRDTHTLGSLLRWIKSAIIRIRDNKDYQSMYEDLRHAFLKIFGLNPKLPIDDFKFNTDELNREQIHNIKTLPVCITSNYFTYEPDNFSFKSATDGYLYQGASGNSRTRGFEMSTDGMSTAQIIATRNAIMYYYGSNRSTAGNIPKSAGGSIYNMYRDDITGDDILDITRGNVTLQYQPLQGKETFFIVDCGTEVFTEFEVYCFDDNYTLTRFQLGSVVIDNNNSYSGLSSTFFLTENAMISRFDWHPLITYVTAEISGDAEVTDAKSGIRTAHCMGDIYHPLFISCEDMASINEVCIFSEFYMLDSEFRKPQQ